MMANGMTDNGSADDDLARRTAAAMYESDRASQMLGMRIEDVRAGYARLSMTVRREMTNGHETCHGGLIFTLADSAFAFACNSRNERTVASGGQVDFVRPAYAGDTLLAEAVHRSQSGRTGVYDINVTNQDGALVALMRGRSHRIRGQVIPEEAP